MGKEVGKEEVGAYSGDRRLESLDSALTRSPTTQNILEFQTERAKFFHFVVDKFLVVI